MAIYICFGVFLLFAAYASFGASVYEYRAGLLKKCRAELLPLYVKRANLMPALMNAARKHEPIPEGIYTRFVRARDEFSAAKTEAQISLANAELDIIFDDFKRHYLGYGNPSYLTLAEELDSLTENIAFKRKFCQDTASKLGKVMAGPLKPGVIAWQAISRSVSSVINLIKKKGR